MLRPEGRRVGDDQVEVQLLGRPGSGPGRAGELGHLLEGDAGRPRGMDQDQPVPALGVVGAGGRGLVTGAVAVAKERPVELGQPAGVGAVEDDLLQGGVAARSHAAILLTSLRTTYGDRPWPWPRPTWKSPRDGSVRAAGASAPS